MDDTDPKPLPPLERFKNLCDQLAEETFKDDSPLSPQERTEAVELRTKLVDFAKAYGAWLEKGKPLWGERTGEDNARSESKKER